MNSINDLRWWFRLGESSRCHPLFICSFFRNHRFAHPPTLSIQSFHMLPGQAAIHPTVRFLFRRFTVSSSVFGHRITPQGHTAPATAEYHGDAHTCWARSRTRRRKTNEDGALHTSLEFFKCSQLCTSKTHTQCFSVSPSLWNG